MRQAMDKAVHGVYIVMQGSWFSNAFKWVFRRVFLEGIYEAGSWVSVPAGALWAHGDRAREVVGCEDFLFFEGMIRRGRG